MLICKLFGFYLHFTQCPHFFGIGFLQMATILWGVLYQIISRQGSLIPDPFPCLTGIQPFNQPALGGWGRAGGQILLQPRTRLFVTLADCVRWLQVYQTYRMRAVVLFWALSKRNELNVWSQTTFFGLHEDGLMKVINSSHNFPTTDSFAVSYDSQLNSMKLRGQEETRTSVQSRHYTVRKAKSTRIF